MLDFLKKEWKFLLISVVIVCLGWSLIGEWKEHKESISKPMIAQIPADVVTKKDLGLFAESLNIKPRVMVQGFDQLDKGLYTYQWQSKTQQEADTEAQSIAKKEDVTKVIKKTEITPEGVVNNKYLGVKEEKKNKISGEIIAIKGQGFYEKLEYQRNRTALGIILKGEKVLSNKPSDAIVGASYRRVLWEW